MQRLKAYRSNLVIFPRNVKKPKVRAAGFEGRDRLQRRMAHVRVAAYRGSRWGLDLFMGSWGEDLFKG